MKSQGKHQLHSYLTALAVFVSRLHLLPANMSAVGSFGFFSSNIWLYLGVTVLFDWSVGGFYAGFLYTYLGFLGYFILGRLAGSALKKQIMLLPLASLFFFLISNFGVWIEWYPHTWEGLIKCYVLALPFYRNTLLGDLIFGYGYLFLKALKEKHLLAVSQFV